MTSLVENLAGRHLVITGFTGFVAKVTVALILKEVPDIGRISVLIRPRSRLRPALRRAELAIERSPAFRPLRAAHGEHLNAWLSERFQAIDADIEQPMCGISDQDLVRLADADVVVHCAGLTDFQPDPARGLSSNVTGALHVADLAERLDVPMVHVSTCFVAGSVGKAVVAETPLTVAPNGRPFSAQDELHALQVGCQSGPTAASTTTRIQFAADRAVASGWPNIYTSTKALAEHLLQARPNLRLTIARPSIVECSRRFPFPGWNEGINTAGPLAWLISTAFRRLPAAPRNKFDVVPVDDVAVGLTAIASAAIQGEAKPVYQLASSDHHPFTFDRAVDLTGLGMRRWARKHGTPTDRALLQHLDPVPVPIDEPGLFAVDRVFRAANDVRRALTTWRPQPPFDALDETRTRAVASLSTNADKLKRVQEMLRLFRPFVYDNDWEFRTDHIRELTAGETALRFDLRQIDWCDYWVNIEYPGLRKWCIPRIEGRRISDDKAHDPPVQLVESPPLARVAQR